MHNTCHMLFYVRHGESTANVKKVFAGQTVSAPLTEHGKKQARYAAGELSKHGIRIDTIISSPLERAIETAQIIAEVVGYDPDAIISDPRLLEYDMGVLAGTQIGGIASAKLISAKGAEDPVVFHDRVKAAIEDARKRLGNTLLVSHSGVARMAKTIARGGDPKNFHDTLGLPNSEIVDFDAWLHE